MTEDPATIRLQAKHCRMLASRMYTPSSREMLERIARELEQDAIHLELQAAGTASVGAFVAAASTPTGDDRAPKRRAPDLSSDVHDQHEQDQG